MNSTTPQDTNGGKTGQAGAGGNQAKGDDKPFNIPPVVLEKYPELAEMIKNTESMSREEREYWFQILPIMTKEQVDRLRKILEEESVQLAKLDQKYQKELQKINKKHMSEWNTFEKKQDREDREKQETAAEDSETLVEAALLEELEDPDEDVATPSV